MAVPHVHPWPKEAVSHEGAIGPQEHLAGASACISLKGSRHVCSTCETETKIQTEEDIPVGNLSHDDSMESITYTGSLNGSKLKQGHLGTREIE